MKLCGVHSTNDSHPIGGNVSKAFAFTKWSPLKRNE